MVVLFYGCVLEFTGGVKSVDLKDCPSLMSLVDELGCLFGEQFKAFLLGGDACFFLINGKGIMATGGFKSKLSPGDKIEILPLVEAG